jgi:hypothetical protein
MPARRVRRASFFPRPSRTFACTVKSLFSAMISPPKNCRLAIATCRFLKVLYKLSATRDIADCQFPIANCRLKTLRWFQRLFNWQSEIGNRQCPAGR